MRLAYSKPLSHIRISALTSDVIPNSSLSKKLKPVNPAHFYSGIFIPYLLTIQEMDLDEHVVLACRSSVHYLYKM
jgi:hypothetical protein